MVTHIAYFHPYHVLYGAGRSLLGTLKHLDRSKFIPHLVVVKEGPFSEEAKRAGIDVTYFPWLFQVTRKQPFAWMKAMWQLQRWFHKKGIGLAELNLWPGWIDGGIVCFAAHWAGIPFILRNRVQLPSWLSLYDKFWISRVDRILSVSEAAVKPAFVTRRSDRFFRVQRNHVSVILDGRSIEALKETPSNGTFFDALRIPKESRIVGMVGAVTPGKRQDLFLRAAALVEREIPNIRFFVIGSPYFVSPEEGAYAEELRRLVEELRLSKKVFFTGYRDDALSLMRHFDVLVLPSKNEGLPSVLIEAMALGVPAVASSVGGIPEVIQDGVTGFLVHSSEPEAYADAIVRLLNDADLARRIRQRAQERVSDFDSVRLIRLLEREYGGLLNGRGH